MSQGVIRAARIIDAIAADPRTVAELDRLKSFLPALRETAERISRELG